jgi:hypothetical protein
MIQMFIARFHGSEDVFLHGCCYWFAYILRKRFRDCAPVIMHDPVEGHFVTRIDGRLYDVRGDVTDLYVGHTLDDLDKIRGGEYARLMRDCRDFIDPEEA